MEATGARSLIADRPHRLRLEVSSLRGITVVRPVTDRIDLALASELRSGLVSLIKEGHGRLVLDLGTVSFIDSSGLSALVSALKMLRVGRERRASARSDPSRRPVVRGDVRLAALQPPVASILEIIRLDRVFPIHESVEEAVQSYA